MSKGIKKYVIDDGYCFFFFQAEDGIRDIGVTGVQTCALPISVLSGILLQTTASSKYMFVLFFALVYENECLSFCKWPNTKFQ